MLRAPRRNRACATTSATRSSTRRTRPAAEGPGRARPRGPATPRRAQARRSTPRPCSGSSGRPATRAWSRCSPGDDERSPVHDVVGSGGGTPLDDGDPVHDGVGVRDVVRGRARPHRRRGVEVGRIGRGERLHGRVGHGVPVGHYDPGSPTGQRTIAHELSHVVQQSQGPVDGTAASGGIKVSDPSDRFEQAADHQADTASCRPSVRRPVDGRPRLGRRSSARRIPRCRGRPSSARQRPTRTRCPTG